MDAGAMKTARYKDQGIDFVLWDKIDLGCGEQRQEERLREWKGVRTPEEGGQSIL